MSFNRKYDFFLQLKLWLDVCSLLLNAYELMIFGKVDQVEDSQYVESDKLTRALNTLQLHTMDILSLEENITIISKQQQQQQLVHG